MWKEKGKGDGDGRSVCQDQGRRKRRWPVTPKPLISFFAPLVRVAALRWRFCLVRMVYFTRIGDFFFFFLISMAVSGGFLSFQVYHIQRARRGSLVRSR